MKAFILAAGLGTRLRPLTTNRAKPSLPVMGIPMLWYSAWHLHQELGIDEITINMSHAASSLQQAGNDSALRQFTGIEFRYSDETKQILGSTGCLKKVSHWIGTDLTAVCNADSIFFPSWKKMLEFHHIKQAMCQKPILTLHVRPFKAFEDTYTSFTVDPMTGHVTAMTLKSMQGLMFSGVYLLEPQVLDMLPHGTSELRSYLLEPLMREGRLFAFCEEIPWFDAGNLSSYIEVQLQLLNKFPQVRELVETKMREEKENVWIPKSWDSDIFSFHSPTVIMGNLSKWSQCATEFGPRFVGIEPPARKKQISTQNAFVFGEFYSALVL